MTIPLIFTRIKRKIESSTHLDDKSKKIVLHLMLQVYKSIPQEDIIYSEDDYPCDVNNPAVNKESMDAFKSMFGDIFKGEK